MSSTGKTDEWHHQCGPGEDCGSIAIEDSATCFDSHEGCRDFSLWGECQANPTWMKQNCRKSCGVCVVEHTDSVDCKDMHSSCPLWASELECFTNPAYMSRACPKSCWLCVNEKELRDEGVSDEEIQKRINYSRTDFGRWQAIPQERDSVVREDVKKMGDYVMKLTNTGPGTVCNNRFHECAAWVTEKGCNENLEFMVKHCSLACQYCDVVADYHTCRMGTEKNKERTFGNATTILTNILQIHEAENLLEGYLDTRKEGEFVLAMKREILLKESETQALLAIIKKEDSAALQWENATTSEYRNNANVDSTDRSGLSAVCGSKCQGEVPEFQALATSIAKLLGVDKQFLQPLEFVHYKRRDRFARHHDFRLHDQWRHSGNRVLTVFVSLQSAEKGGGFGFPELDWLLVENPEVLVWPNVASEAKVTVPLERLVSEQLPVAQGELYGVYVTIREYPYLEGNACA